MAEFLKILHFNDVYVMTHVPHLSPQTVVPHPAHIV
jgi:hypothetical protein